MIKRIVITILAVLLVASSLAGCSTPDSPDMGQNEENGTVNLPYVNWVDSIAITHLAAAVLEDKMGYDVNLTMADVGPVYASVGSGHSDAYLDVWPLTHQVYLDEYGDGMVDLGIFYEGGLNVVLVVPSYVDIDSMEELNANKDIFNGEIIGVDPGAGLMSITERAIEIYDLDFNLVSGSDVAMTASLGKAIEDNEAIVVTAWSPHWMFARWNLKMLEDPRGELSTVENVHKYARSGLEEDMPEVADFFKKFYLPEGELDVLLIAIETRNSDTMDIVRDWMGENEALVNSWL